jgi:hypothetical protein
VRVLVLADTHVRGDLAAIPDVVWAEAEGADVILHAGDVVTAGLLERLAGCAPTHAVLGNNDVALDGQLPLTEVLDLDGVRVAMIHDSGATAGRDRRMHARFPDADLVIYGHSHQPDDRVGVGHQRIFNPGSCTQRRRSPFRSYGVLELEAGRVITHSVVEIT